MQENNSENNSNNEKNLENSISNLIEFISKSLLDTDISKFIEILKNIDYENICEENSLKILRHCIKRLDRLQITEFIFSENELYSLNLEETLKNKEWVKLNIDDSNVSSKDSKWSVFIYLLLTKLFPVQNKDILFDQILKVSHESKHGSLTRHITIFQILASVDIKNHEQIFSKVIEELRFLLEFLFNEIFPTIQNPDDKYLKEEIQLLQSTFFGFIQENIDKFLSRNADKNSLLTPKIKILKHNDFIDYDFVSNKIIFKTKISKQQQNTNALFKFIGNLLAKLDVATFFAHHNALELAKEQDTRTKEKNQKFIVTMRSYQQTLEKKYNKLFVNAMEIIRAQCDFIDFLKYRHSFEVIDKAMYKHIRKASLFDLEEENLPEWKGYTSFFCLWLWKTRIIKETSYYHLMKPWFVVKTILNQICYLEMDFFKSTPFFYTLFEWLNKYIEKIDPRSLDNINSGNLDLAGLLFHLRYMSWYCVEPAAKLISSIFEKLYRKIPSIESRYRILNDCLDGNEDLQVYDYVSVGSLLLSLYSEEVRKEILLKKIDSIFFNKQLYMKVIEILKKSTQQGYVNLIEGIKSFCQMTVIVLNHDFHSISEQGEENDSTHSQSESRGAPLRIESIQKELAKKEYKQIFKTMNKYLQAKIKDLKEILSSDRLNNELGDKEIDERRLKAKAFHIKELEFFQEVDDILKNFLNYI